MDAVPFMTQALALGWKSAGHTRPNPPVGAVIVRDGGVLGEGRHVRCGQDHAEAAALKDAVRRGADPAGATVFCTLEPCSKPGRVGACCDALIAAHVARVEWLVADPNPTNRNAAAHVLGAAGIATRCWQDDAQTESERACVAEAERLIAPFAKHVTTGLPFVTVKLAMSLDGRICDVEGCSQWMSSVEARQWTGRLRERADCMLVGAETVRRDNPSLLSHGAPNDDLWRAVVSHSGNLPQDAQIFTDAAKDRTRVYRDPVAALRDLGARGMLHVVCEGGLGLARSLVDADLVDEWIDVRCPIALGSRPLAEAVKFDRAFQVDTRASEAILGSRRLVGHSAVTGSSN